MGLDSALALIESVKDYSVLFVGDPIVDQYTYVEPLGKSSKEYLIPVRHKYRESYAGGVFAAQRHVASFCKTVDICTSDTSILKRRYVDATRLTKLFEVHEDPNPTKIAKIKDCYDVLAVADFGHGRIDGSTISEICGRPFVALAVQTNSANMGFNLITKYPRADYIVIDELEARLAAADKDGHIEDVIHKLAHGRCERFVVTHGQDGAYGYDHGKFFHCKAFTDRVVDTMGAGDAFFAITAPMAKTGSMEDLLLIGNAAGALKTQIVGHRKPVTKEALIGYLKSR